MALWSYPGTPYTGRVKVRALIGDVDIDDQIIQDYEIDAVLAVFPNETEAAAHICRNLSAKFAVQGDITVGKYRFDNLSKAEYFQKLSAELFKQVFGSSRPIALATPSYGGISQANKDANSSNTDNVPPKFYRNQFEDPNTEPDDDTD